MPHLSPILLASIALLSLLLPLLNAQAPGAGGAAGSADSAPGSAGGAGGAAKPKAEIDEEGEGAAVPVAEAPIVSPTSGRPSAYLLAAKAVESQSMFEGHEAHVLYTLYNIGDRSAAPPIPHTSSMLLGCAMSALLEAALSPLVRF